MSKKIIIPKKTIGYGYSGVWNDGGIGWFMPNHVSGAMDRKYPSETATKERLPYMEGQRLFLCKITVEPIVDEMSRPITKIVPKIKKNDSKK